MQNTQRQWDIAIFVLFGNLLGAIIKHVLIIIEPLKQKVWRKNYYGPDKKAWPQ